MLYVFFSFDRERRASVLPDDQPDTVLPDSLSFHELSARFIALLNRDSKRVSETTKLCLEQNVEQTTESNAWRHLLRDISYRTASSRSHVQLGH